MKELTNYFTKKDIIFKQINEIMPKELGSRKKIGIYHATSVKKEFYAIFIVDAKSRFLRKNADDLMNYVKHFLQILIIVLRKKYY